MAGFNDSFNYFLCIAKKIISYIHFSNSSEEFENGCEKNKVTAGKIPDYQYLFFNMHNICKTVPDG